jgi:hypothetical protein
MWQSSGVSCRLPADSQSNMRLIFAPWFSRCPFLAEFSEDLNV